MDEQELTRKIGLLLKKAEGTDNEAEASVFYGKAYELMTKYAIDEQRVRAVARQANRQVEEPVMEDYMFATYAHHASAKEELLRVVLKSQGVRFWPYRNQKYTNAHRVAKIGKTGLHESQWCRVLGYKGDIENSKLLFISLLIQASRFANEDWRLRYGEAKKTYDGEGKFMWISAHMEGFAHRIGERFNELREDLFKGIHDANALWVDKDTNIQEWMYDHGYARRPDPKQHVCWEPEPVELRPRKNAKPRYCVMWLADADEPHPHRFTYKVYYSNSSYVAKGRQTSYEGRDAGKAAGNRADIGLGRVAANRPLIKG